MTHNSTSEIINERPRAELAGDQYISPPLTGGDRRGRVSFNPLPHPPPLRGRGAIKSRGKTTGKYKFNSMGR